MDRESLHGQTRAVVSYQVLRVGGDFERDLTTKENMDAPRACPDHTLVVGPYHIEVTL